MVPYKYEISLDCFTRLSLLHKTAMILQTILVIFALSANLVEGASIAKEGGHTEALTLSQENDNLDDTTHNSLKTKSNVKGNYSKETTTSDDSIEGSMDGEDMKEPTKNDNAVENIDVMDEMDLDDVRDDNAVPGDNGNMLTKIFHFLMKNDVSIAEKKVFFSSMLQHLLKGTSDTTERTDTSSGDLKDTNNDRIDKVDSTDDERITYIAETNTVQEHKEKSEVEEVLTSEASQADWKSSSTHMPNSDSLTSSSSSPSSINPFDLQPEYVSVGQTTAISTTTSPNNSNYTSSSLSTDTGYQRFTSSDLNVAALETSETLSSKENIQISSTVTSSYVAPIEIASNVELTASTFSSNTMGTVGQLVLDSHSKLATNINNASSPETYVTTISNFQLGNTTDLPLTEMEDEHQTPRKDAVTNSMENALSLQQVNGDKEIRISNNTKASGGPMETNHELLELVLNQTLSGLYDFDDSESNESDDDDDDEEEEDDDDDDHNDDDNSSDESNVDDDVDGRREYDYEYDDYNNKDRRNGNASEVNTKVEGNINGDPKIKNDVKTSSSPMQNILDDSKYFIKTVNVNDVADVSVANVEYYQMMTVPKKAISVPKEYDKTRDDNVVQQGTENDENKKSTEDDSGNETAIGDKIEIVDSTVNEGVKSFDGKVSGNNKKDKFWKEKGMVSDKDKKDASLDTDKNKPDSEGNRLYVEDVTIVDRMENTFHFDNESEEKEGLFESSKRKKSLFDKGVEGRRKSNDELNKKNRYDHDDAGRNDHGRKHNEEHLDIAGIYDKQKGQKGEKNHLTEEQQENNEDTETTDDTNEKKLELTDDFGALVYENDFTTNKNEENVKEAGEKETSKENSENDNFYSVESRKENNATEDNVSHNKTEADVNKIKDEVNVQAKFVVKESNGEAEDDIETSNDKDVVMHYENELPSEKEDNAANKKTYVYHDKEDDIVHITDGAPGNNVHGDGIVKTRDKAKFNIGKDKHIVQTNEQTNGSDNEEDYKPESKDKENENNDEEEIDKTDDDAQVSNDKAKYFDEAEEGVQENNSYDKDVIVKNAKEKITENAKMITANGKSQIDENEDNIADADTNTKGDDKKSNDVHAKENEENDRNDEIVMENNDDNNVPVDVADNSKAEPITDMDTFDDDVNEDKVKNNKEKNVIFRHINELKKPEIDDEVSLDEKGKMTIAGNINFEDVPDEKDRTEHKAADAKRFIGQTVDIVKEGKENKYEADDHVYTMIKEAENDDMDLIDDHTRTDDFEDRNDKIAGSQKDVETKDENKAPIDASKDINKTNETEKKEYEQINMDYHSVGEEISAVTETENMFSNSDNKTEESTYGQKPDYLKIESDLESTANISFSNYGFIDEGVGHENKNMGENRTNYVKVGKIDKDAVYAQTENNEESGSAEKKNSKSANNVSFKNIRHNVVKVDPKAENDSYINDDDEGKKNKKTYNYERGDGSREESNETMTGNLKIKGTAVMNSVYTNDENSSQSRGANDIEGRINATSIDQLDTQIIDLNDNEGMENATVMQSTDQIGHIVDFGVQIDKNDTSVNENYKNIASKGSGTDEHSDEQQLNILHVISGKLKVGDNEMYNIKNQKGLTDMVTEITNDSVNESSNVGIMDDYSVNADYPVIEGNIADYDSNGKRFFIQDPDLNVRSKDDLENSNNQNSAVEDEKWSNAEYGVGDTINGASDFYGSDEESISDQNTKSDGENEGMLGSLLKIMKGGSNSYIVFLSL